MNVDTFLYVPRMIIQVLRDFEFNLGFVTFSAFDFLTMIIFVSIVITAIRSVIYD